MFLDAMAFWFSKVIVEGIVWVVCVVVWLVWFLWVTRTPKQQ